MKAKLFFIPIAYLLASSGAANAVVIDFTGGTAYLNDGTAVTTTDTALYNGIVDYYIEDGILVDFVGGYGTIGDYYNNSSAGGIGGYGNSVIHAHPFTSIDIVFTKLDGSTFDLTYVDMTSNSEVGGDLATGNERSFLTNDIGYSLMLAPSDWGVDYTFYGSVGDGVVRNWMDAHFLNIASFTISSENAYCFGMDNFYIDEAPPVPTPEPMSIALLGTGLFGLIGISRRKAKRIE